MFQMYRPHREGGDARKVPSAQKISRHYIYDIWNADDFKLFYKSAPDTSIEPDQLPGRKKQRDSIILLVWANGDISEKNPMNIKGNSAYSRCFAGKNGRKLGIDYFSSPRA